MLLIVLMMNIIIASLCVGVAWQVWRLRRLLSQVADTLILVEKNTQAVLQNAPDAIYRTQLGIYQLRELYRPESLRKALQVLGLLRLGQARLRQFAVLPLKRPQGKGFFRRPLPQASDLGSGSDR